MHFLESEFPPSKPEDALFHVIPAPYEKTTSYGKGAARGPAAIIAASQQLEAFDGTGVPGAAGIHTAKPVSCAGEPRTALRNIERAVSSCLSLSKIPVVLGGEHTVTLGAIRALVTRRDDLGIIQFDAHADLRDTYGGTPYSHACVMRRCVEMGIPLVQFGVRALCLEEHAFRTRRRIPHRDAVSLQGLSRFSGIMPARFPKNVYVTFDLDAFDPAIMPATGTPVPGGLFWHQAVSLLQAATKQRRIIGFDVVELAPDTHHHAADFLAAQLVYTLMALAQEQ